MNLNHLLYKVSNCYGDPNKVYIGESTTFHHTRKYQHKRKYGADSIVEVIDEAPTRTEAEQLESKYIHKYRDLGFEVLNLVDGGCVPKNRDTNTKLKISNSHKQLFKDGDFRNKRSRAVIQLSLNDEPIAEYPSAIEAARSLGKTQSTAIIECCKGKRKQSYNFKFKYKYE